MVIKKTITENKVKINSQDNLIQKALLEKIAKLTHTEWKKWSKELAKSENLSKEKLNSWKKLWTNYSKLPKSEKEKDLIWANKFMEIIMPNELTQTKAKKSRKDKKNTKKVITKLEKTNTKVLTKVSLYSKLDKDSRGLTRNGFGQGLLEAGKKYKNIVALCADLTGSVKVDKFANKFPTRFFEVGICEQNMMGMAAGMCLNNKIPLVSSYAAFNPGRNWDQLRVSVCYSNHNVKVLGGHAGLTTGPDGATHQALEDIAITRVIPNLDVIVPCDEIEAKKATLAMFQNTRPTYLRVSREKSLNITNEKSKFEIGKANVLDRGNDVTIIACGITVQFALEAKELLLKENINATVINLHTISPIDEKTIVKYAKLTGAIVTAEEHQINGGMGSAVSEILCRKQPTPQEFVGVNNTFGESGDGYELLKKYGVSVQAIVKATKKVISRKQ
jgi:transketolase